MTTLSTVRGRIVRLEPFAFTETSLYVFVGAVFLWLASDLHIGLCVRDATESDGERDRGSKTVIGLANGVGIVAAALASLVGVGLAAGNWVSLGIVAVAGLLAYGYRIRVEERALREELGDAYETYAERTPYRLLAGLW